MSNLKGKSAMVTGAGSGLGRASALALARHGVGVAVADIDDAAAAQTVADIRQAGGSAIAVHIDICSEALIREATEATVRQFGRLDILHNNAAYTTQAVLENDVDILTITTENWDLVMQGTLRGTMLGCRYGIIEMLKTGGGSIINTSSMYGVSAFNKMPAYGVSKAAINLLTAQVATAYGRHHIRCNAIAPSMIRTPLLERIIPEKLVALNEDSTLTGYLGTPEDIANIVVWLASEESRYITGQVIRADGGSTAHLPTYSEARQFFQDK